MTREASLPSAASLSVVRIFVNRPRMCGWHRFLAIRTPGWRKATLLHLATLHRLEVGLEVLAKAAPQPLEPLELERFLRRRLRALKGRKHARQLTAAVLERLAASGLVDLRSAA